MTRQRLEARRRKREEQQYEEDVAASIVTMAEKQFAMIREKTMLRRAGHKDTVSQRFKQRYSCRLLTKCSVRIWEGIGILEHYNLIIWTNSLSATPDTISRGVYLRPLPSTLPPPQKKKTNRKNVSRKCISVGLVIAVIRSSHSYWRTNVRFFFSFSFLSLLIAERTIGT